MSIAGNGMFVSQKVGVLDGKVWGGGLNASDEYLDRGPAPCGLQQDIRHARSATVPFKHPTAAGTHCFPGFAKAALRSK